MFHLLNSVLYLFLRENQLNETTPHFPALVTDFGRSTFYSGQGCYLLVVTLSFLQLL